MEIEKIGIHKNKPLYKSTGYCCCPQCGENINSIDSYKVINEEVTFYNEEDWEKLELLKEKNNDDFYPKIINSNQHILGGEQWEEINFCEECKIFHLGDNDNI